MSDEGNFILPHPCLSQWERRKRILTLGFSWRNRFILPPSGGGLVRVISSSLTPAASRERREK